MILIVYETQQRVRPKHNKIGTFTIEKFGQSKQGPPTPFWLLSSVWCSLLMSWLTKQTFSGYESAREGHGKATSLQLDEARDVTELAGLSPVLFVPHHFSYSIHLNSQTSQDPVSVQGGPKCLQMALPPVAMEIQPNQRSLWTAWLGIWINTKRGLRDRSGSRLV